MTVLCTKVCRAVQHAHQKGVIHRDIEPSNVLVTMHDGVAVPKVIDFGTAKALHRQLGDGTIYTEQQQVIGTPAYMSPEQAAVSGLDIATRSDIDSLGVLLEVGLRSPLAAVRREFGDDEAILGVLDRCIAVLEERGGDRGRLAWRRVLRAAVAWLDPKGEWGALAGGYALRGSQQLSFVATQARGGERNRVGLGLIDSGAYPDTARRRVDLELTSEWARDGVPLDELDLSRVRAGFELESALTDPALSICFDDVRIE